MKQRKGYWYPVLLFTVLVGAVSCSAGDQTASESTDAAQSAVTVDAAAAEYPVTDFLNLLSQDERSYVDDLENRGGIRFAIAEGGESYNLREDGTVRGFDYHFAIALAGALGLEYHFEIVEGVTEFYAHNGSFDSQVMSDESIVYTPDAFSRVDLFTAPLAVNPWRQRLSAMIPLFPAGLGIIGKQAGDISSFKDLDGLSAAVKQGDFQGPLLRDISESNNISIELREYGEEDVFELLRQDFADITIDGSLFLARGLENLRDLQVAPLKPGLVPVAWAVQKENIRLQSIVAKFISYSLNSGLLSEIFSAQMGVDFDFYLSIVGNE